MTDELIQKTYTAVLKHFMRTGKAPHYTELSCIIGVNPDEALKLLHSAAEAGVGCWLTNETDYVESWAPFYNAGTNYSISVSGEQKWNGQGGLESLAVRWLFPGSEICIESRCLDCAEPIRIRMKDEKIIEMDPPTTVGHMNVPLADVLAGKVTFGYAGSRMNLFRSEEHVKNWSRYNPVSKEAIIPVADWAKVFSGPLFRNRLNKDYLSHTENYLSEFLLAIKGLGKTGPFWTSD